MNYEEIAVSAAIALWGFWEYREREIRHLKAIRELREFNEVDLSRRPNWGRVTTTLTVIVLLVIVIIGGAIFASRLGYQYGKFVYVLLLELIICITLLLAMAIRDIKLLRRA